MIKSRVRARTTYVFVLTLIAAVCAGCTALERARTGRSAQATCRMLMIFGGGPSRPMRDVRPGEKNWMVVHVSMSDSTYEFGHLARGRDFEAYSSSVEGIFQVQGGMLIDFALRELAAEMTVYPLEEYGACEFAGPAMRASLALFPRVEHPYHSIAKLTFITPGDTVRVEITTSSPNGFGPADL